MFSHRVPPSLAPNRFSTALASARRSRRPLFDLTVSNPTGVGLEYPIHLLRGLGDPDGLRYRPDPMGLDVAREAAAAELRRRGVEATAGRVFLTASTSEAYALLFKLLCDPGDDVLVPRPSYPLFDHLTSLDAVRAVPYDLEFHGVWSIDQDSVQGQAGARTRAVLVVAPNNPTGSMLRQHDRAWLDDFCAERRLAVVSDEVFADYPLRPGPDAVASVLPRGTGGAVAAPRALTFAMGGLSKSVGLPQMKLAWTAVAGPDDAVAGALARLELICDTYLSVATPVQLALPALLRDGATVRDAIHARVSRNLGALEAAISAAAACSVLPVEAGWSAVVRVPSILPEEELVLRLLEEPGVVVHPGYFFDFPAEAYLVVSLLPAEPEFDEGISRLFRLVQSLEP